jgi:hypothetical protein
MRLLQKNIIIVTKTSDPETWNKTDQMKRVLCKNALDFSLLDFDDEDDIQKINEKKVKNSHLPLLYIDAATTELVGTLEQITLMSNNKQLNAKCRYYQ